MTSKQSTYVPRHLIVSVTVEKDSIRVSDDTLTMCEPDDVKWQGTNARRFKIVFDGQGPFADRELPHEAATRAQRPRMRGEFKYSVVSADDPGVVLDPVIVIEEPPTGPTP